MRLSFLFSLGLFVLLIMFTVGAGASITIYGSFDPVKESSGVTFTSWYPSTDAWVLPTDHTMNITVKNDNGSSMNVGFYWANNDSLIGTDTGVANNSVANVTVGFDYARYQVYSWYVQVWSNQSVNHSFTGEAYDWDINRDANVNYLDASALTSKYGQDPWTGREDVTGDDKVNYLDASLLTSHYGEEY